MDAPFSSMPANEPEILQHPRAPWKTATLAFTPSGPEWISRQDDVEIKSLPWTPEDRVQLDVILRQRIHLQAVRKLAIVITWFWQIFCFEPKMRRSDEWTGWEIALPTALALVLAGTSLALYMVVSKKLQALFCNGVILGRQDEEECDPSNNNSSNNNSRMPVIHVDTHQHPQNTWTSRQTDEEIVSVEGWTEEDLEELVPLLQQKSLYEMRFICWICWISAFLLISYVPDTLFPAWYDDLELSEGIAWFFTIAYVFFPFLLMSGTGCYFYWAQEARTSLQKMFVWRFLKEGG